MDLGSLVVVGLFAGGLGSSWLHQTRKNQPTAKQAPKGKRAAKHAPKGNQPDVIFGEIHTGPKPAATFKKPHTERYVDANYGDLRGVERVKTVARERAAEVRAGFDDLIHRRAPTWRTGAPSMPDQSPKNAGGHGATAGSGTKAPSGRRDTQPTQPQQGTRPVPPPPPPPWPPARPGGAGGAGPSPVAFFESADLLASAPLDGIVEIHRLLKVIAEGNQRYEEAVRRLAQRMQEPDVALDRMITDPLIGFAAYLQAGTMKAAEADAALTALLNMTVQELAESSLRAPNSRILNSGAA